MLYISQEQSINIVDRNITKIKLNENLFDIIVSL